MAAKNLNQIKYCNKILKQLCNKQEQEEEDTSLERFSIMSFSPNVTAGVSQKVEHRGNWDQQCNTSSAGCCRETLKWPTLAVGHLANKTMTIRFYTMWVECSALLLVVPMFKMRNLDQEILSQCYFFFFFFLTEQDK